MTDHSTPSLPSVDRERNDQPRCETCRFWTTGHARMECHRLPPMFHRDLSGDSQYAGVWPETDPHEWCGEHQPRGGEQQ